jgi:hypothetical protein
MSQSIVDQIKSIEGQDVGSGAWSKQGSDSVRGIPVLLRAVVAAAENLLSNPEDRSAACFWRPRLEGRRPATGSGHISRGDPTMAQRCWSGHPNGAGPLPGRGR